MGNAINKSVGLFGYYGHFNFGDDLMALIFGQAIRKWRAECVVYSPGEYVGKLLGARSTHNIDELVAGRDLVVYGGGGALIPQPEGHAFSNTMARLLDSCSRQNVPLICLSVGGSGIAFDQVTPPARRQLVTQSSYVSLRTRHEWELYRQAGIQADYFQDVVWLTSNAVRVGDIEETTSNFRVLVNLYPSSDVRPQLDEVFASISKRSANTQWDFVETHTFPAEYWQAFVPTTGSERFATRQFHDVHEGLKLLASYDLVITNRLHVGIAAMSYGVRSLALFPVPKTRMCYRELGLESLCWDAAACDRLEEIDDPESRESLFSQTPSPSVQEMQTSAASHLQKLEPFIHPSAGS